MSMASVRVDRLRRRSNGEGSAARRITRAPEPRVVEGSRYTAEPGSAMALPTTPTPRQRTADAADDGAGQVVDALAHQVVGRQILGDRQRVRGRGSGSRSRS